MDKITILLDNCVASVEIGQDIKPLLDYVKNEYKIIVDDFQIMIKKLFPLIKAIKKEPF